MNTYEQLSARFDKHSTRKQGGTDLTYLTGEQVISRLNEVLGFHWSFRVLREGSTETEAWVLGELTATIDGTEVTRQHYGNQDLKRGSYPSADLFKSAATDAIKKAATTLGVGLYLYDEDERREVQAEMREAKRPTPIRRPATPQPEPSDQEQATANAMVQAEPTVDPARRVDLEVEYTRLAKLAVERGHKDADKIKTKTAADLDYKLLLGSVRVLQLWEAKLGPVVSDDELAEAF